MSVRLPSLPPARFRILKTTLPSRPASTLVEVLVFLVVFAIVAAMVLPLLFQAVENQLLQQSISLVEQNGMQALQAMGHRAQAGERILDPPMGETGSVVAFQTGSGVTNPTIVGVLSGSLVIIRHTTKQMLTSPQVAVEDFLVRNTSASATQSSFTVSFRVSRTLRLQAPHVYSRTFEALFSLSPDDSTQGDFCGCDPPFCQAGNVYVWEACEGITCGVASTQLECDLP